MSFIVVVLRFLPSPFFGALPSPFLGALPSPFLGALPSPFFGVLPLPFPWRFRFSTILLASSFSSSLQSIPRKSICIGSSLFLTEINEK